LPSRWWVSQRRGGRKEQKGSREQRLKNLAAQHPFPALEECREKPQKAPTKNPWLGGFGKRTSRGGSWPEGLLHQEAPEGKGKEGARIFERKELETPPNSEAGQNYLTSSQKIGEKKEIHQAMRGGRI